MFVYKIIYNWEMRSQDVTILITSPTDPAIKFTRPEATGQSFSKYH